MKGFGNAIAAALIAATAADVAVAAVVTPAASLGMARDTVIRQAVGGQRPVWVQGAPPDGSGAAAVAAALRTPGFSQPTTFTPADNATEGPTLVLVFGAQGASGRVCRQPGRPAETDRLIVTAALCVNRRPVRVATLRGSSAGPTDPAFADEMAELTSVIYRRSRRSRLNE